MQHEINDAEQLAFETRLRSLRPRTPVLDRDQLMYLSGRRSIRSPRSLWPMTAIISWTTTAALVGFLLLRLATIMTETRVVERIVHVPRQTRSPVEVTIPMKLNDGSAGPSVLEESVSLPIASSDPLPSWSLDDLERPLTAGSWYMRDGDWRDDRIAVAKIDPPARKHLDPAAPEDSIKTYGQWRQEFLANELF